MEGAVGLTGAKYVGEIAPRDGTLAGYLTGTAFLYALDPERFRVDFKTYEFVGIQPGTSVNFVRTDVPPGMKAPADILKARGLVVGSLGPVSSKGARLRLGLDLLGIPFKYISGYRSGGAAKLAIEQGEINFYGESTPSYFSIIEPGLVKSGTVIPIYYDSIYDGRDFVVPDAAKGAPVSAFHEFYQTIKGTLPSGQLWEAHKGLVALDGNMLRLIVMPPGSPPAVTALREALVRLNSDKATPRMPARLRLHPDLARVRRQQRDGKAIDDFDPRRGLSSRTTSRIRRTRPRLAIKSFWRPAPANAFRRIRIGVPDGGRGAPGSGGKLCGLSQPNAEQEPNWATLTRARSAQLGDQTMDTRIAVSRYAPLELHRRKPPLDPVCRAPIRSGRSARARIEVRMAR